MSTLTDMILLVLCTLFLALPSQVILPALLSWHALMAVVFYGFGFYSGLAGRGLGRRTES